LQPSPVVLLELLVLGSVVLLELLVLGSVVLLESLVLVLPGSVVEPVVLVLVPGSVVVPSTTPIVVPSIVPSASMLPPSGGSVGSTVELNVVMFGPVVLLVDPAPSSSTPGGSTPGHPVSHDPNTTHAADRPPRITSRR
jgi:hypothetical protein